MLIKPLEVYVDAAPWGQYSSRTPIDMDYFNADSEVRRHLPWYQRVVTRKVRKRVYKQPILFPNVGWAWFGDDPVARMVIPNEDGYPCKIFRQCHEEGLTKATELKDQSFSEWLDDPYMYRAMSSNLRQSVTTANWVS
jgi:hypothetical protein